MLFRLIIILTTLGFANTTAPVASTSDPGVILEGSADCGLWVEARTAIQAQSLEHYLLGLLNGMALTSQIEFWKSGDIPVSRSQVYLWMDKYCQEAPLSNVLKGAVILMNERTGNAFDRR